MESSLTGLLRRRLNESNMKKESGPRTKRTDELRPEYDLSLLRSGVRGKYYQQATAGINLVLIDPDLSQLFPDSKSVNRALRVIADAAQIASKPKAGRALLADK